ncbi:MAG: hypothetical protein GX949_07825 [Peptococcaceae bacterium]|jgi:hypothetical protein|nr:hypothetical protein [Peptococcaceae bacterium]
MEKNCGNCTYLHECPHEFQYIQSIKDGYCENWKKDEGYGLTKRQIIVELNQIIRDNDMLAATTGPEDLVKHYRDRINTLIALISI